MTDHNQPPTCRCNPEWLDIGRPDATCPLHGTMANRHPHYREAEFEQRPQLTHRAEYHSERRSALDGSTEDEHAGHGCSFDRPAPGTVGTGTPPTLVDARATGYVDRCPECAALPPHHTRKCSRYHDPTGEVVYDFVDYPQLDESTGYYARNICDTAADLVNGDRNADYGDALDNFTETAALWSPILGIAVTAEQVALCMAQVKVARLIHNTGHRDSWVDGVGYLALGGGIARRRETDPNP